MYLEHFGLEEIPFRLTIDQRFLYLGQNHHRTLRYLHDAAAYHDGIMVLTAPPGTGKTCLLQHFVATLDDHYEVIYIAHTQVDEEDLLRVLLQALAFEAGNQHTPRIANLVEILLEQQGRTGKRVLLLVDEAQNLTPRPLATLYQISALASVKGLGLNLYLVGQPQLGETLTVPELATLRQRITLHHQLAPFDLEQTQAYIRHRLYTAKAQSLELFTAKASRAIQLYSSGIAQQINSLCDHALASAAIEGFQQIDASGIKRSARELALKPYRKAPEVTPLAKDDTLEQARLTIQPKEQESWYFPLGEQTITLGRLAYNELPLPHHLISRQHARISKRQRGYFLEDLSSTNGTFVNGKPIQGHWLNSGDLIRIGKVTITFHGNPQTAGSDQSSDQLLYPV